MEIKATSSKVPGKEVVIEYNFGSDLDSAVALFGKEQVFKGFIRAATISAQALMRSGLEKGMEPAEIAAKMKDWKPGAQVTSFVDPVTALLNKFPTMTAEQQQELLKALRAKAAQK